MKKAKNGWTCFLLILAGVVLGGFIGSLVSTVPYLNWLNYGQSFGLDAPVILNLGVMVITIGFTIKITMASILGIILAIVVYRFL